jgi:hypothetical protein
LHHKFPLGDTHTFQGTKDKKHEVEISPAIFLFLANWCKILPFAGELQPATITTGV